MQGSAARRILSQAWPIFIAQLAAMAYATLDTMMTGHASSEDLAAMAIGASVYFSIFVALMGVIAALNPIVAHHYGAGDRRAVGVSAVQGLWLALLLSLVGAPLLAFPELWLDWITLAPEVRVIVVGYVRVLALALPAALSFRVVFALNTAISRPKVVMVLQSGGLLLKAALNYALIFGAGPLPALGAVGCAIASAVVYWAMFAIAALWTGFDASYREFELRFAWPSWELLKPQLRLGVPMGLSFGIEVTSFTFMALLVARLGTEVVAGHQIIANLASVCFQVPIALGVATATCTAQALGAREPRLAGRVAMTGIYVGLAAAALTSLALWWLRVPLVGLYTADARVAAVALSLIGYLIAFHVFDALQGITGHVLRAHQIALVPTLIYAVALWGVGLAGGYALAFGTLLGPPRGASGLWLMQAAALCLASLALLALYLLRRSRVALAAR